jgi:pyruvate dehydrogenase (quinone)
MGPGHVENLANLACRSALANRTVSHICIPIDEGDRYKRNVPGHTAGAEAFVVPRTVPAGPPRARRRVAARQAAGGHPRGRGAGAELEEVAERLGAVIVKALLGKDCVPDDSPYVTGGTGVVGTRPSQEASERCDALIIVGSSFPYIEFLPPLGQPVCIQIDDKAERIGLRRPADVGLVGDARLTLRELIPLLERGTRPDTPMKPQVPLWHLHELLTDDAIVCGDSGTVTTWIARWKLRKQQKFSFSGTMCSMMAALPYAIGAQAAYPDRQVVAYTGDGSLMMMMGELATLAQEQLPVKVIVNKNCTLGLIKWEQQIFLGNPEYACDFDDVDFVKIAEGCGLHGVRIDDPAQCRDQLAEALELNEPVLIECVTDPHEPPHPPQVTTEQTKLLAEALARGEEHRKQIALTVGRDMLAESAFSASPYGIPARLKERVGGILPGGDEDE